MSAFRCVSEALPGGLACFSMMPKSILRLLSKRNLSGGDPRSVSCLQWFICGGDQILLPSIAEFPALRPLKYVAGVHYCPTQETVLAIFLPPQRWKICRPAEPCFFVLIIPGRGGRANTSLPPSFFLFLPRDVPCNIFWIPLREDIKLAAKLCRFRLLFSSNFRRNAHRGIQDYCLR